MKGLHALPKEIFTHGYTEMCQFTAERAQKHWLSDSSFSHTASALRYSPLCDYGPTQYNNRDFITVHQMISLLCFTVCT